MAIIYRLYANPLSGPEIESLSFAAIDREAQPVFNDERWSIVRRMIHTCGDPSIAEWVRISEDAVAEGAAALRRRAPIYVDSNMIRAGMSLPRLREVNSRYLAGDIFCHVADSDVSVQAVRSSLPRSLFAIRKARPILDGGIVVFGNAPVALLELNRMILEEGIRPALVIAMPVGFVHVVESKEEFLSLRIPYVAVTGRRGGSALAVSTIHALCALAAREEPGSKS